MLHSSPGAIHKSPVTRNPFYWMEILEVNTKLETSTGQRRESPSRQRVSSIEELMNSMDRLMNKQTPELAPEKTKASSTRMRRTESIRGLSDLKPDTSLAESKSDGGGLNLGAESSHNDSSENDIQSQEKQNGRIWATAMKHYNGDVLVNGRSCEIINPQTKEVLLTFYNGKFQLPNKS